MVRLRDWLWGSSSEQADVSREIAINRAVLHAKRRAVMAKIGSRDEHVANMLEELMPGKRNDLSE